MMAAMGACGELRLVFLLPASVGLVAPGQHEFAGGCVLTVSAIGTVVVTGAVRSQIFAAVEKFLSPLTRKRPALAIQAVLESPPGHWPGSRGRDSWSIIINAGFAFAPTRLPPEIPARDAAIAAGG